MKRRSASNGPGDKTGKARSKKNDTISPYYASVKYGGPVKSAAAKSSMASYWGKDKPGTGSRANRSGESEATHMSRMSKRDTIASARKPRGRYELGPAAIKQGLKKKLKK